MGLVILGLLLATGVTCAAFYKNDLRRLVKIVIAGGAGLFGLLILGA
jgi:hypothetical protein